MFTWTNIALAPAISSLISLLLVLALNKSVRFPAPVVMRLLFIGTFLWAAGNVIELTGQGYSEKLWGIRIAYIGVSLVPVAWLVWLAAYTNHYEEVLKKLWPLLLIPSLTSIILAWTSEHQTLLWISSSVVEVDGTLRWQAERGAWWYVQVFYGYLLMVSAILLVIREIRREPWAFRHLVVVLTITLVPLLWSLLFVIGSSLSLWSTDYTSSAYAFSLLVFAFVVGDPLKVLLPISRNEIIRGLRDAIFTLDSNNYITSFNKSAQNTFGGLVDSMLDRSIFTVLPLGQEFVSGNHTTFIDLPSTDKRPMTYEARRQEITGAAGDVLGSVLILRNRTEEYSVQEELTNATIAMEQQRSSLQSASNDLDMFMKSISKEIQLPLDVCILLIELLDTDDIEEFDEEHRRLIARIKQLTNEVRQQINKGDLSIKGPAPST